jgi:uncharacterized protein
LYHRLTPCQEFSLDRFLCYGSILRLLATVHLLSRISGVFCGASQTHQLPGFSTGADRPAHLVNLLDKDRVNPYIVKLKKGKESMIIKLYDIEHDISVKGVLDGSRLKRPEDTDVSFLSPIEYDLTVSKSGVNLWVQGPIQARLALSCARCLEEFAFSVRTEMEIELLPRESAPSAPELELKTEEMNAYYYEGEAIDLDPFVFEEVMLNMPIKALCSEACKGICPICGKNLNLEECRCEKTGTSVLGEKFKSFLKER